MHLASRLKNWAKTVKRDGVTLWFAARHSKAPWYAKALGVFVVAYASERAPHLEGAAQRSLRDGMQGAVRSQ